MVSCRQLGPSSHLAFRRSGGKFLTKSVIKPSLIDKSKMAAALMATGWWMYLDVPQTPNAVVLCVIIFNAAFGYRYLIDTPCTVGNS
jgi:RsiW-degrading membrane proteinase PrsW (M82 family)